MVRDPFLILTRVFLIAQFINLTNALMCHSVIGCPCELGMDKSVVIYLYLKEVHKEDLKAGAQRNTLMVAKVGHRLVLISAIH